MCGRGELERAILADCRAGFEVKGEGRDGGWSYMAAEGEKMACGVCGYKLVAGNRARDGAIGLMSEIWSPEDERGGRYVQPVCNEDTDDWCALYRQVRQARVVFAWMCLRCWQVRAGSSSVVELAAMWLYARRGGRAMESTGRRNGEGNVGWAWR